MNAGEIIRDLSSELSAEFEKLGDKVTAKDRTLAGEIIADLGALSARAALGESVTYELAVVQASRKLMTSGAAEAVNRTVNAVMGRIAKVALEVAGTFTGTAINVVAASAGIKLPHL